MRIELTPEAECSTNWFLSGTKPDALGRVRGIRARPEDREDRTQSLGPWLGSTENIQISLPRTPEVGCPVDIQVKVKRPSWIEL